MIFKIKQPTFGLGPPGYKELNIEADSLIEAIKLGYGLAGHFNIPIVPLLHNEILIALGEGGTLDMSQWHGSYDACETTHCRAGWAITLAGEEGRLLEDTIGAAAAGALIHAASCPFLTEMPDFYATDAEALAGIEACAAREREIDASRPG